VISQRLLGTTEIAIFHHTDCGMLTFTNDDIRHKVKTEEPGNAAVAEAVDKIDFLPFPELEQSVRDDVNLLKESQLLKAGTHLSGWIYDVTSGKVCNIFFVEGSR
jgi:carbonic anhydrase